VGDLLIGINNSGIVQAARAVAGSVGTREFQNRPPPLLHINTFRQIFLFFNISLYY
jgi:hypothetical protein